MGKAQKLGGLDVYDVDKEDKEDMKETIEDTVDKEYSGAPPTPKKVPFKERLKSGMGEIGRDIKGAVVKAKTHVRQFKENAPAREAAQMERMRARTERLQEYNKQQSIKMGMMQQRQELMNTRMEMMGNMPQMPSLMGGFGPSKPMEKPPSLMGPSFGMGDKKPMGPPPSLMDPFGMKNKPKKKARKMKRRKKRRK